MKSAMIKKVVLTVLLLVLVYIWWGNIRLFYYSQVPTIADIQEPASSSVRSMPSEIPYNAPRVNPFARKAESESPPPNKAPERKLRPQSAVSKLSGRCQLKGLIDQKQAPQVVIATGDSRSVVLSLRDSLENWELTKIAANHVVFRQDKTYDTLWLDGYRP